MRNSIGSHLRRLGALLRAWGAALKPSRTWLRRPRRRTWITALAVLAIVAAGVSFEVYRRLTSLPDIHRGNQLPYIPPKKTGGGPGPTKGSGGARNVADAVWTNWGFDLAHTRFNPAAQQHPPFRTQWSHRFPSWIEYTPAVDSRRVYVALNDGTVVAISSETGRTVWRVRLPSQLATSPAINGKALYVTALRGAVYALSRADGHVLWKRSVEGHAESPPIVHLGVLYFGTGAGKLYALRASDGKTIWKSSAGTRISGSPAYASGRIVVGSYDGAVYAFGATSGRRLWRTSGLGRFGGLSRGGFFSTPAIAYGRVYIGSLDHRVYSLVLSSGEIAWTHATGGVVYGSPAVANQKVFIGSFDGKLYALSARTGAVHWTYATHHRLLSAPTVIRNIVYFSATGGGGTYGLRTANGAVRFQRRAGIYTPVVATKHAFFFVTYRSIARLREVARR